MRGRRRERLSIRRSRKTAAKLSPPHQVLQPPPSATPTTLKITNVKLLGAKEDEEDNGSSQEEENARSSKSVSSSIVTANHEHEQSRGEGLPTDEQEDGFVEVDTMEPSKRGRWTGLDFKEKEEKAGIQEKEDASTFTALPSTPSTSPRPPHRVPRPPLLIPRPPQHVSPPPHRVP